MSRWGKLCRLVLALMIPALLLLCAQQWLRLGKARADINALTRDLGLYRALAVSDCVEATQIEDLAREKGWTVTRDDNGWLVVRYSDVIRMAGGADASFLTFGPDGCLRP